MTPTTFTILLWQSHPDAGNDDCLTELDFANEAAQQLALADLEGHFGQQVRYATHAEIVTATSHEVRNIDTPAKKRARAQEDAEDVRSERAWRREIANEAGMGGGVAAYNEVMGF